MNGRVLRNATSGGIVATSVVPATNPFARALGLLARKAVAPHEGVWIGGCSAVHTVGMRATLDLYFLDRDGKVLKVALAVPPRRLAVSCHRAATVVELGTRPGGAGIALGDTLVLE